MTFCFFRITSIIVYALIHDMKFVVQEDQNKKSFLVEIPRWLWHSKDPYAYSATAPTGRRVYQFR